MSASPRLHSVNVSTRVFAFDEVRSGIDKRGVAGRVAIAVDGVVGDQVLDRRNHGGVDKAVYAYALEDAEWWSLQIGQPVAPGRFGENLTTVDVDVSGARIGEHWRIGSAVLEVAQPRIPCRTFARFWERAGLIQEFTAAARPGAYLRVVEPGEVEPGDEIEVVDRPDHEVTIAMAFRARTGERDLVPALLSARRLPSAWLTWAGHVMEQSSGQGS